VSAILATALAAALAGQGGTLASGTFGLPAAWAFGKPGFRILPIVS